MNDSKPVLVSDMGGVLYSFSQNLDPKEHEELFDNTMQVLGIKNASVKHELEGEFEAVSKGLLKIYANESGIANLKKNSEMYSIVVISTSLIKTSELMLKRIGLNTKGWKIFDMSDFGSKKDPQSWQSIFKTLPRIDVIVEDGEKNLIAAKGAAEELGYSVQAYESMPLLKR